MTDPPPSPRSLEFTVFGPVSPKGRPRFSFRGNRPIAYTPAATRSYEAQIREVAIAEIARSGWTFADGETYRLEMRVFRQKKIGDGDNYLKLVDGLNKVAWKDDRYVRELHLWVYEDKQNPRLEIVITKL